MRFAQLLDTKSASLPFWHGKILFWSLKIQSDCDCRSQNQIEPILSEFQFSTIEWIRWFLKFSFILGSLIFQKGFKIGSLILYQLSQSALMAGCFFYNVNKQVNWKNIDDECTLTATMNKGTHLMPACHVFFWSCLQPLPLLERTFSWEVFTSYLCCRLPCSWL